MPRLRIIDDQGEVTDHNLIAVRPRVKAPGPFVQMFLDAFLQLATAPLRGTDYKVLMCLLAELDYENKTFGEVTRIATDLQIQPSSVCVAIKRLIGCGVLLDTGEKVGKTRILQLNPGIAWRGRLRGIPGQSERRIGTKPGPRPKRPNQG